MSQEYRSSVRARINNYGRTCRAALDKTRANFATQRSPYMALDSNLKEIRVLVVDPGTGLDIVTCTLKRISLLDDQVPFYETISYCWGSTRDESFMKLNGSLISVPSSSEAAVRRMRFTNKRRVLWIDAICIDQSSQSEKARQVAFMSTIYSLGKQNLIYLGEDDARSAGLAVKSVQLLISKTRAEIDNVETSLDTLSSRNQGSTSINTYHPDVDFTALERLFELAWFTRLWIVQEVLLALTSTCHWGEVQVNLRDILHAATCLGTSSYRSIPTRLRRVPGLHCAMQMSIMLQERLRKSTGNLEASKQLFFWMCRLQSFQKTEPRDSVFSILGLMNMDKFSIYADAALLEVDYTKPLPDVLRDATRYAICQRGDMTALDIAEPCSDQAEVHEEFPSWAARIDLHRWPTHARLLPDFYQADKGLGSARFLADTTYGADVLLTEGFVVDEVIRATPLYPSGKFSLKYFRAGLRRAKAMAVCNCGPTCQEVLVQDLTTMAFVVTAGATQQVRRAQPEDMVELSNYLVHLDTAEGTTNTLQSSEKEAIHHIHESLYLRYSFPRQFFMTSEGNMGLGPTSMQANDLVVVLRGGKRPFILREKGEFYQLIGPAYVHGIMDGEAVETWKAKNEPEILFKIR